MSNPLQLLSLGAGVQSTTLLLMSDRGELPRLDAAVFADTQWEPAEVYDHLAWLKATVSIPIHTVTAGNLRDHSVNGFIRAGKEGRYASLPLRVLNPDGSQGMIRRQCTREYKVEPIERWIKTELLGLSPDRSCRWPTEHVVDQWFGISVDEASRMRDSDKRWRRHVYPLTDLRMSRQACIEWLRRTVPGRHIPKSACIGCPYKSNKGWRYLRDTSPAEWADAIEVDETIRHADKMDGQAFLHRDLVPLKEARLDDLDQTDFGWDDECLGYCGN